MFILSVLHIGSTTSTILSVPVLSGSFTPIVIVFASLKFPDVSFIVPAGNDILIGPL